MNGIPVKVLLKDIVDALEMPMDEYLSFVNLDTGEVETASRDLLSAAEESDEEPDIPAWQHEEWELAQRIISNACFVRLPTKRDIHEWSIMEDFAHSVSSDRVRSELLDSWTGRVPEFPERHSSAEDRDGMARVSGRSAKGDCRGVV